jgi:hypothetical protein
VTNMIGSLVSPLAILQVKETNRNALIWGDGLFVQLSSETFRRGGVEDTTKDEGLCLVFASWCYSHQR